MKLIITHKNKNSISLSTCGGKGFNLFRLENLFSKKRLIPKFFCINSLYSKQIFQIYDPQRIYDLLKTGQRTKAEKLSFKIMKKIERFVFKNSFLREELKKAFHIISLSLEEGVIVRSSATVEDLERMTCPGQFKSALGITDLNSCVKAIAEVLCSAFSKRFFYYPKNINKEVPLMAVIIQKILDGDLSGVLYTTPPVGIRNLVKREKIFYVEMIRGMPEPLLSGRVTPACFFLDTIDKKAKIHQESHQDYSLRWKNNKLIKVKSRPLTKMSQDLMFDLISIGNRIKAFFKANQDIEWLYKDKKIYILQARPIVN